MGAISLQEADQAALTREGGGCGHCVGFEDSVRRAVPAGTGTMLRAARAAGSGGAPLITAAEPWRGGGVEHTAAATPVPPGG